MVGGPDPFDSPSFGDGSIRNLVPNSWAWNMTRPRHGASLP